MRDHEACEDYSGKPPGVFTRQTMSQKNDPVSQKNDPVFQKNHLV
jgi:hypothetical protein|tara:strand:- start:7041 stop:7175 length:135 start_codon:yes stop_codon:yes gene_type:complete